MNFWIFNYNQPNAFKKAWFIFIAVTLGSILLSVGIKDLKFDYEYLCCFTQGHVWQSMCASIAMRKAICAFIRQEES